MARKLELTWCKGLNLWAKIYRKKKYYLGKGRNKSDMDSYKEALARWEAKKLELDKEKPNGEQYATAIRLREEMVRFCELEGFTDKPDEQEDGVLNLKQWHDKCATELKWLHHNLEKANPPKLMKNPAIDPLYGSKVADKIYWAERIKELDFHEKIVGTPEIEKTIGANIDLYIQSMINKAKGKQITKAHASKLKSSLDTFKDFSGNLSVETFNGKDLEAYYNELMARIGKGASSTYYKVVFTNAKMFIRWLWRNDIIKTLPRNLDELKIKVNPAKPKTYSIEEIKFLLNGATGRTKLFLLLMLNTGCNQIDLAELKPQEVDWIHGRIIRKRHKTEHNENVPTVNYKLFKEAFTLLKEFGTQKGERVFLNANGKPLVVIDIDDSGKEKRIDNIKSAYNRLCKRLKVPCKPMKYFRSTSATLLYNKEEYMPLYDLLLDHAPKGVGQVHYADAGKGILDKAIDYLAKCYGIK